jgi:hypothetical protein
MIEDDAAAAVWREHDRFLPSQQSRQHSASIGRQAASEVSGHHCKRARENIGKYQIVA